MGDNEICELCGIHKDTKIKYPNCNHIVCPICISTLIFDGV